MDSSTVAAAEEAPVTRAPRALIGILTAFWCYVALSNVMYARNMSASLTLLGMKDIFAPWQARLLQYAVLFPFFLVCMWLARRIRWRPAWRAIPLQLACGIIFSGLASPALVLGEALIGDQPWHEMPGSMASAHPEPRTGMFELPLWLAAATNTLLAYAFGVALVTGFDFYRRLRDAQLRTSELEHSLSAAQLAALRMQLSPHTLFNLLNTIRGQISWDPAAAQSMVVQLADLLRRVLRAGDHEFSRLGDEFEFARLYLSLQQKRFQDRLSVSVPDALALPPVWVPSLILQPLIENAAVHGLAGSEGAVTIQVEASVTGESLLLRVINTLAASRPPGEPGIGLRNVRERLAIHFGERASLTTFADGTQGWIAEIRMPVLRSGP